MHSEGLLAGLEPSLMPSLEGLAGPLAAGNTSSGAALAGDNANLSVPAYSSLPGAKATLYLDFNGHYEASWGTYSNIDIPAYSQDSDPATFSSSELSSIQTIWRQVAEDYSPFNVNVTTVDPGSFANGSALRVSIGGNGSWYGSGSGGVSYLDSFTTSVPNVAFVFPGNLANGTARYVGEAVSHEAGHAFGLNHQSQYSSTGSKISEYYSGPGDGRAPIMGNSYSATRGLWWYGTTLSASSNQDDMAVLSRPANGFGYRPDEAGNTAGTASPLQMSGTQLSGSGVISTTSDLDYWSFTTGGGAISLNVGVPSGVNNLDVRAQLVDAGGNVVVGWQDFSTTFGATINANVPAGSFRLVVGSHGGYGDVGQYTVSGTIVAPLNYMAAPTNLNASAVSTSQINLNWTDQANNESGYQVERSQNGSTWTTIATLGAGSSSFANSGLSAGTAYTYRVRAVSATATSDYSNQSSATTMALVPAAPSNLTASSSKKSVALSWSDNSSNETGFKVQRSSNGSDWSTIATVAANIRNYTTSKSGSGTIYFRIVATSPAGDSSPSNTATVAASGRAGRGKGARSLSMGVEAANEYAMLQVAVSNATHASDASSSATHRAGANVDLSWLVAGERRDHFGTTPIDPSLVAHSTLLRAQHHAVEQVLEAWTSLDEQMLEDTQLCESVLTNA
jgi:hypothetical protein